MMNTENRWNEMRAAVLSEARQPAMPRSWMREGAAISLVHIAVALSALFIADLLYDHSAEARSIGAPLFLGAAFCGVIATLALGRTARRFAVAGAGLFAFGAVAHVASRELTWEIPWWASANCALGEFLMAALPALVTTTILRRFAFQAERALLGGVAAAATGLWVLDLTCPAHGAYHALVFHLVPALLVVAAALFVRRVLSSHTHVP